MKISINNIGAYLTCAQIKELGKVIDGLSDEELKRFNRASVSSPSSWIFRAFCWNDSIQGYDYWYDIFYELGKNPNCYKDIF